MEATDLTINKTHNNNCQAQEESIMPTSLHPYAQCVFEHHISNQFQALKVFENHIRNQATITKATLAITITMK
jgi:hypothetical protein